MAKTVAISDMIDRFNKYWVEDENGCHIWQGVTNDEGYGYFNYVDPFGQPRIMGAHRWIYTRTYGLVPEVVLHTCDVRNCVNLAHLIGGTHRENMLDMVLKGRQHSKLTAEQVLQARDWRETGEYTAPEIAEMYGVSKSAIYHATSGRTWAHI
jgi:hypothetical protein